MFYRVNVRDAHEIGTGMAHDNHVSRHVEAPSAVETVVGCQAMGARAGEDGIVVSKGVLWIGRKV